AEIDYASLAEHFSASYRYKPMSPFAPVKRDLALVCDEATTCGAIMDTIRTASPLVRDVSLFDVYRGKNLGEGKKSMAFSIELHDSEKELSPEAAERAVKKILSNLKFKMNIEMR
ncbi:MAG: phenylalanine--tRNA ligase subunit beta, partial [Oscillospiraceae bacterium]|nr:phenylalanine--tRNA ligase subunit beta [Oscillospiraceae bacterium]